MQDHESFISNKALDENAIKKFLYQGNISEFAINFIVNLLKEIQSESANKTSNIESLRTINEDKKRWFGESRTDEEIKEQVSRLIAEESNIEELVWALAPRLQLPDKLRIEFLQRLSDRLDNLALRFCPEVPRYAKLDRKVDTEQTAAGVLTYAIKDGKTYVLLGKRDDEQLWECFGGKSDEKDVYLHNTAAREVFEESSKQFAHTPVALMNAPFHDVVTEKNGQPFIFRLYFREHDFVDPNHFQDSEHTEYQWVELSDLHKGIEQKSFKLANGKQTVNVYSDKKTLTLYPEFYQLITQHAVEKNISRLQSGYSLISSHTQSTHDIQQDPARHFHSPEELSWQIKKSVLDHLSVIRELKEKFKAKHENTNIDNNVQTQIPTDSESQSELHLRAILGDKFNKDDMAKNVEEVISLLGEPLTQIQKENLKKNCLHLLELEKQGGPDRIYFYHAADNKVRFAYDIYNAIHQIFQADPTWRAFRATHEYFAPFDNIESFITYYSNLGKGTIDNNTADYNETTLSTNWALFGNHLNPSSYSILYLLQNKTARNVDLATLLKNILASADLPEVLLEPLLRIYEQHYANSRGSLYQLSIPTEIADNLSYAAESGGVLNAYKSSYKLSDIKKELKNDLDSGDPERIKKATDYLKTMQARLMVPPHQSFLVNEIRFDELDGNRKKQNDIDPTVINNLVQEIVFNAITNTLHPSTPYERLLKIHAKKNALPLMKMGSRREIKKAIDEDQRNKLELLLNENPELRSYAMSVCISEGKENVLAYILQLYPQLKDAKIQRLSSLFSDNQNDKSKSFSLFEAITSFGGNLAEGPAGIAMQRLMSVCFGPDWMHHLPKNCTHTADSLLLYVWSLPENERYALVSQHLELANSTLDRHPESESILGFLTKDEGVSFLLALLIQKKMKQEEMNWILDRIFYEDPTAFEKIFSEASQEIKKFADDWLQNNHPDFVLNCENYVSHFGQKYALVTNKSSPHFFGSDDFLPRLEKTQGTLAKYYLIKSELKNADPNSMIAKVADEVELDMSRAKLQPKT